jgi:hypothetical protein
MEDDDQTRKCCGYSKVLKSLGLLILLKLTLVSDVDAPTLVRVKQALRKASTTLEHRRRKE